MSVNKVSQDTGELITLSSGVRVWCGSKTAHTLAITNHTMPANCLVCITDDFDDQVANVVEEGNMKPVTSNAVYDTVAVPDRDFELKVVYIVDDTTGTLEDRLRYVISNQLNTFNRIYIGFVELVNIGYGNINISTASSGNSVRGTITISSDLYVVDGTVESPVITLKS